MHSWVQKVFIWSSGTNRFSFGMSNFSFSLACWATTQASHLPTQRKVFLNLPWIGKIWELLVQREFKLCCTISNDRCGNDVHLIISFVRALMLAAVVNLLSRELVPDFWPLTPNSISKDHTISYCALQIVHVCIW